MSATYRGIEVCEVRHNPRKDVYTIHDAIGSVIAELKPHEFMSFPQLRTIGDISGRHRKTHSKVHGGAAQQSGCTVTWRTISPPAGWPVWSTFDPGPAPPIEHAGIRAGEVIAPRAWEVRGDSLFSVYTNTEWLPDDPMQGDPREGSGVHAFKDLDDLCTFLEMTDLGRRVYRALGAPASRFVIGTVALWGEIVEHERGYRAEFGRVASLDWMWLEDTLHNLQSLRARYGLMTDAPRLTRFPGIELEKPIRRTGTPA